MAFKLPPGLVHAVALISAATDDDLSHWEVSWRKCIKNVGGIVVILQTISLLQKGRESHQRMWRIAIDEVVDRIKQWTSPTWIHSEWIIPGGEYFARKLLPLPLVSFDVDDIRTTMYHQPQHLLWYMPLAKTNRKLPVPSWTTPLPGQMQFDLMGPSTIEDVQIYMKIGKPAKTWTFGGFTDKMFELAAEDGAIFRQMVKQRPNYYVHYIRQKRSLKYFALMVAVADGYYIPRSLKRFFAISSALPLELQVHLAGVVEGSGHCMQYLPLGPLKWIFA